MLITQPQRNALTKWRKKEKLTSFNFKVDQSIEGKQSSWGFDVKSGDILVVKGPSGCGKSTLLKSIISQADNVLLQSPATGEFKPISHFDFTFSYVPQETTLIQGTVKENICLGGVFDDGVLDEVLEVSGVKQMMEKS